MTINGSNLVDIHTHVYVKSYLELLRKRNEVPRILPPLEEDGLEKLVILPDEDKKETKNGRPVTEGFFKVEEKIKFMLNHGIDKSVISLANPWLDFYDPNDEKESEAMAKKINDELQEMCDDPKAEGRLYAFGVLPLNNIQASISQVKYIKSLKSMRGIIMGTNGCGGKGLDDPALIPLFETIRDNNLVIFLHPHYGIQFKDNENTKSGHVIPLSIGFPVETTIAVTQFILSGIFDKLPNLKLLLAHSGGTLPFLAGRLDSCVIHDPVVAKSLKYPPSYYLKKLYYDAVIYHETGISATVQFTDPSHVMFGTDHPFFPPLDTKDASSVRWLSVDSNLKAIQQAGLNDDIVNGILGENAIRLFNL
ncbi:unnamed protein product [Cunninghamella blakesleeana]